MQLMIAAGEALYRKTIWVQQQIVSRSYRIESITYVQAPALCLPTAAYEWH